MRSSMRDLCEFVFRRGGDKGVRGSQAPVPHYFILSLQRCAESKIGKQNCYSGLYDISWESRSSLRYLLVSQKEKKMGAEGPCYQLDVSNWKKLRTSGDGDGIYATLKLFSWAWQQTPELHAPCELLSNHVRVVIDKCFVCLPQKS